MEISLHRKTSARTRWPRGLKTISVLIVTANLLTVSLPAAADSVPSVEEIRDDIRQFQAFFLSRFPGVPLDSYRDGVAALPQYSRQRVNRDLLLAAPPHLDEVEAGKAAWDAPMSSGLSLRDCFSGKPPPIAYPYFFDDVVHTVAGDINQCRSHNGEPPLDAMDSEIARLVAAFKDPWRGQPLDVDYREEEVRRLYAVGRQYFWAKRGQMNLSCANCHVHNAGNRLRGHVLSAALGHGMGYPVYSIRWSQGGEPMGTLHRQYAYCNALAGAAPLKAQSETYIGLELYQAIMNSGIPLNAPALKP